MVERVVIVPGNGAGDVEHCNWYGWLREKISQLNDVKCILRNMPDPIEAKESVWIPFMRDEMNCDEKTIIVGHSSGAEAAMRFAEKYRVFGIILVSACVTDLGMESERVSGYYSRPWEWEKIKANTNVIIQYGSTDDPFIPWSEQQQVADGLNSDLRKFTDKGHFMTMAFPDLFKTVKECLEKSKI